MMMKFVKSQSPFGFWGDWNLGSRLWGGCGCPRHNRLSAFGVIGTMKYYIKKADRPPGSHNRLSAFGVIGTLFARTGQFPDSGVTIAFRLLG